MTPEEKAKAYDGLIERLKDLKFAYRFSPLSDTIEDIFPELKESEDEKIRKVLIELSKEVAQEQFFTNRGTSLQNVLDWIEKQGEQKSVEWSKKDDKIIETIISFLDEFKKAGYENAVEGIDWLKSIKDRVLPKQEWSEEDKKYNNIVVSALYSPSTEGLYNFHKINRNDVITWFKSLKDRIQLKPAWSEEDEKIKNALYKFLNGEDALSVDPQEAKCWLNHLMERVQPQPKQEWSEEDESMLQNILECLKNGWRKLPTDILKYESWLKSLRPQSQWKPSDEQLACLKIFIEHSPDYVYSEVLESLLQDLKKLREEQL